MNEIEKRAAQSVVDLDADETVCPACETRFETDSVSRCPECGLNFG
jgi:tRNA(Ile2) C34 agmatinyltransferase TiaS